MVESVPKEASGIISHEESKDEAHHDHNNIEDQISDQIKGQPQASMLDEEDGD
jgi:hypothetical protein